MQSHRNLLLQLFSGTRSFVHQLGPGFIVAATGIGAGDMIAASVGGAKYGVTILWASVVGAILKFVLNEGIARWQLVTGVTLMSSWILRFRQAISIYFLFYLIIWSFMVAGALMVSCGMAAHAFFPDVSVPHWGMLHALAAFLLIYVGRYSLLESIMKIFIGMMFLTVISNLFFVSVSWSEIMAGLFVPSIPEGGGKFVLGIIGGVGGSVTLLCYGYWLREKGWQGAKNIRKVRVDLGMAYGLTGLFGVAVIILAAGVKPELMTGNSMVLSLADELGNTFGSEAARWIFMAGFWGAVFSSMLGVWSGVPYLFNDFVVSIKSRTNSDESPVNIRSWEYRAFLLYLTFPPMLLLYLEKPVWIVLLYAIAGAFFMPFLAALLLVMNNRRRWVGELRNSWIINVLLVLTLLMFGYLLVVEVMDL